MRGRGGRCGWVGLGVGVALVVLGRGAAGQEVRGAAVSGVVRDAEGAPVAGAQVEVRCGQPVVERRARADAQGMYRIAELPACRYAVRVTAEGFAPGVGEAVVGVGGSADDVRQDLRVVKRAAGEPERARPALQAAGIHGSIDPGGYSASVDAEASAGVLRAAQLDAGGPGTGCGGAERPEQALAHAAERLRQTPSAEAALGLAYAQVAAGETAQARETVEEGLRVYGESVALRVGLGVVLFVAHDAAGAEASLLQAQALDPKDSRPYLPLAAVVRSRGDGGGRVRQLMERHVAEQPEDANGLAALGLVLAGCDGTQAGEGTCDPARAERLLQRAVELRPLLDAAHAELAALYRREGRAEPEAKELEAMLRRDPRNRELHYQLGLAYRRSGAAAESAREMEVARQLTEGRGAGKEVAALLQAADAPGSVGVCREPGSGGGR